MNDGEEPEEVDLPYLWLSDDDWNKLMFHARGQINAILNPLRAYGQGVYVDGATTELLELIDQVSQYVRGKDIPIIVRSDYNHSPLEADR